MLFLLELICSGPVFLHKCHPQSARTFLIRKKKKNIFYVVCLVQCYIAITMVLTQHCMLAIMAYDCYLAISNPLHYTCKMSKTVYVCLVIVTYVHGFLLSEMENLQTDSLSCDTNEVNHFYCANLPVIKLACSDSYSKELSICIVSGSRNGQSLPIILISYLIILVAIFQSHSAKEKGELFSHVGPT